MILVQNLLVNNNSNNSNLVLIIEMYRTLYHKSDIYIEKLIKKEKFNNF